MKRYQHVFDEAQQNMNNLYKEYNEIVDEVAESGADLLSEWEHFYLAQVNFVFF